MAHYHLEHNFNELLLVLLTELPQHQHAEVLAGGQRTLVWKGQTNSFFGILSTLVGIMIFFKSNLLLNLNLIVKIYLEINFSLFFNLICHIHQLLKNKAIER